MLKIFSQEDFALRSKLWPANFLEHLPIFAGNSRSTGISQLRAGKTRSKRPRSHWLSTVHLLPYMWASFYPLDPSRYLSSFSSWRPKSKKFPFFHEFPFRFGKKIRWAAADSILTPLTFPIASLNRYNPKFSGIPQKLTWCQQFGLQIFPKWGDAHILPQKNAVFRCFFGRNKFSRPNGRLSPIACHT